MSALHEVHSTPSLRLLTSRNLILGAWLDAPSIADLVAVGRASSELNRQFGGCGMLSLILRGTPRFSDDVRRAFERLNADPTAFALGAARVLLMDGLAGVAVKAFLNTTLLVAGAPRPVKAFTNTRDATMWLAPKLATPSIKWAPTEMQSLATPLMDGREPR